MGTRHLQTVINKEGEIKLAQYGQWDGYPDGQGLDILKFLRNSDLDEYLEQCNKLKEVTQKDIDKVNESKNWKEDYPYLSRDCGSDIHQMILNGDVKFIEKTEQSEANKWCECFYTIDFSKNKFIAEFHGVENEYNLDSLPSDEEFISDFVDNN